MLAAVSITGAGGAFAQTSTVPLVDVSVRIQTEDPALEIDGQIVVPARTRPVESIELQIDRRIRDLEVSVVTPPGPATVSRKGNSAIVTLATPVPPGSPVTIRFRHRISANSTRSFYIARDAILLSGESYRWYPLPSSHRRATGRLRFHAPDDMNVVATGRRIGTGDADGWVRFEVTDPTTFSFAAGRHEVYTSPGEPAVALHLLKARSRAADRLALIRQILTVLVDEFGRYPHPDLEVVEMPAGAMGSAENGTSLEGFVVVGSDIIERASLATLAHEISHQWWTDSVFAIGPGAVLLTEAMANYGALRAFEGIHGQRAAAEARWRGFPGESLFAGGRGHLSLARAGLDAALTSPTIDALVGGNKGMLVHDLLSRTIGRERFKTVLRSFTRDHAFQDTTWPVFVDAVRAAEPEIGWFFEQWYGQASVPSWTVWWSQTGGEVSGVITQSPPYFRVDIDVALQGSEGRELHRLRIDGPRTEFAMRTGIAVVVVQVDPEFLVPHDGRDRVADVDAIAPLGEAIKAARAGSAFNDAAISALRDAENESVHAFIREALLAGDAFERGEWEAARVHVDAALANGAQLPETLPGLYYTQAVLACRRSDRLVMERAAREAIEADGRLVAPTGWSVAARELLEENRAAFTRRFDAAGHAACPA
jgi:hypothetical protein